MRELAAVAIVLLVATPTRADLAVKQPSTDEWGAPELVLRRKVRGQNNVLFVLYASGRVLYRDRAGGDQPFDYLYVALTPEEQRTLLDGLSIDRIGVPCIARGVCADCATYFIDAWPADGRKHDCHFGFPSEKAYPEAAAIWNRLLRFVSPRATRWVPHRVTVTVDVLTSRLRAPSSVDWPKQWPTSGEAIHPWGRDGWTFDVDGSELPELRRLQAQLFNRTWGTLPLLLPDGRRVAISFDLALPHQDAWQRP